MELNELNPFIRYYDKVKLRLSYSNFLKAYDFRLFFVVEGAFLIKFENKTISLSEKDMITIPPGTAYKIELENNKNSTHFILNFDFDHYNENELAKAPVQIKHFNQNDIFSTASLPPFNEIFVIKNAIFAEEILDEIEYSFTIKDEQGKHIRTTLLKYLLTKCIIKNDKKVTSSLARDHIEKAKEYIRKNIMDCPTNEAIAKAIGYHPYYLNYLFVTYENITLHKYMDNERLKRAKELLLSSNLPICEIAEKSGFTDAGYFSRFFKKSVGLTPKEYRKLSK